MVRLVACVLALFVAACYSTPVKKVPHKVADPTLARHQYDLHVLLNHIHEPNHIPTNHVISESWSLEKLLDHCRNVTAVKIYIEMMENDWILPRGVPFSILEHEHKFEAVTLFHVLFSANNYDTFYKTAVYLRDRLNENLFVYVLNAVILKRPDTQGITIAPISEIFPWYFHNGKIMTTAQRINTHGHHMTEYYPSTYKWHDSVVIKWNETLWPYHNFKSMPLIYYTHDRALNTLHYNFHLVQPSWLGSEVVPLIKDRRGETFWFFHKQLVAQYYLNRLSSGLGAIPEIGEKFVEEGYNSGLLYHNGIAFSVRPNYFYLYQPKFINELQAISDYEHRIRDVIDKGYVTNSTGEHISLRTPDSIDVLGRLIEANVDSPDVHYFGDFISLWKKVLGNSIWEHQHFHHSSSLVIPSVLEHYQTAVRDPAYFMIWKRVLGLFELWQEHLPHYKREELALPSVTIQKVNVDKLVTYFEHVYVNVSNALYMNEDEVKGVYDEVSVLVQHPRLNHKTFVVRVHVKSEVAKSVMVRFFLAPKYDCNGNEIPLHKNTQNFYQFDEFMYDLTEGESVIVRSSADNSFAAHEPHSMHELTEQVLKAAESHGEFVVRDPASIKKIPHHLLLPKGREEGMTYMLFVHIAEYHAPKTPFGTGFDPSVSIGSGSGAQFHTDDHLGFPVNRPLHLWQVEGLHNMVFHDVKIYHKHTPEVYVPHSC